MEQGKSGVLCRPMPNTMFPIIKRQHCIGIVAREDMEYVLHCILHLTNMEAV